MNPPASRHIKSKERVTAMGLFSSDIKNMDDLFVHTLRDIYYAEKQIVKSLPEMIEKASNQQLKQDFKLTCVKPKTMSKGSIKCSH